MQNEQINPVCIEIGKINISDSINVIHCNWYSNIKTAGGNTDVIAILILADTIYWYTPTVIRSESTGKVIGFRQKFKADKLQRSYKYFTTLFGFSHIQVKRAVDRLIQQKLMIREFRTVQHGDLTLNNVMFLEPIPTTISHITDNILEDPSLLYCKEGVTTELGGDNHKVNISTDTSTETTTIHSKECICASERSAEKDGKLDSTNKPLNSSDQAKPEQNSKSPINVESQNSSMSKTETLKSQSKTYKPKSKPKKVYGPCPTKYEPPLEAWEEYTGRIFRGMNGQYTKGWKAIQKAILGKLFNEKDTPTVDSKYFGQKFTFEDIIYAFKNFAVMRNNADYHPKDKTKIKRISLDTFFYNGFNPGQNKSYFITCLTESPKPLTAIMKDPDPEGTDVIVEQCQNRLGLDLSNGGRSSAIKCVQRLTDYFEENKHNLLNYEIYYSMLYQQAQELFDMLEYNASPEYPIKPMYLYGDRTYNEKMTAHFKRINVWRG
jgi:hypothetical protein